MKTIGIIPARMDSTRFPNKPMKEILGIPMIGHCYWRTRIALRKENTYVATCDNEIFDYILNIGGNAIMTKKSHNRATTRCAEAVNKIQKKTGKEIDTILMIQGDEPLVCPDTIKDMSNAFNEKHIDIVNIMSKIKSEDDLHDKNNVKVVVNNKQNAMYFSREPIPSPWLKFSKKNSYMQTGIIGFKSKSLMKFNSLDETPLEVLESVDMNRALEMEMKIKMILCNEKMIGVDIPDDIKKAETLMKNDMVFKKYIKQLSKLESRI